MSHWIDLLLPSAAIVPGPLRQPLDIDEMRMWALGYQRVDEALRRCPRGDWILWLARRTAESPIEVKRVVAAASACARWILNVTSRSYPNVVRAVEAAEQWADNADETSSMLAEASEASLQTAAQFDPNVDFVDFAVCIAASAACRLADQSCNQDARRLVLLIDSCYPVGAYAWAKAHAVADPLYGITPVDVHRRAYEQAESEARAFARSKLESIVKRYFP